MTDIAPIVKEYDAASAPRGILRHGLSCLGYPQRVVSAHILLWNFFRRELLGRFRGSVFGIFWVLVQPIFQFLVYLFVFGILLGPRDQLESEGIDPFFAVYLFSGIIFFGSMLEATSTALRCLITNGNLVKKVAFPSELLPLTPALVSSAVYAVGCVVLMIVGLATGYTRIGPELLAWPLLVVCFVVFATGFGLLLSTIMVFFRDIAHMYAVAGLAWFFLSPVFWRLPLIRDKMDGLGVPWLVDLLVLNPMYPFLMAQRQVFGIGHHLDADAYARNFSITLWESLGFAGLWAFVALFFGYGFFMSRRHKFADLI